MHRIPQRDTEIVGDTIQVHRGSTDHPRQGVRDQVGILGGKCLLCHLLPVAIAAVPPSPHRVDIDRTNTSTGINTKEALFDSLKVFSFRSFVDCTRCQLCIETFYGGKSKGSHILEIWMRSCENERNTIITSMKI